MKSLFSSAITATLLFVFSTTTVAVNALAAPSSNSNHAVWSESAVQQAKDLSVSQRAKLLAEEGVVKPRSIKIKAERLDSSASAEQWMRSRDDAASTSSDDDGTDTVHATKLIHFQRHGQGYHNLLGDILRDVGIKPNVDSLDPAINPWLRPEIVDSPLTETGKAQCREQRPTASLLNPELVVVSPLLRAIQTAEISFADHYEQANIPWIAHEGCREELGVLVCNKRRPLSQIVHDFPDLEFANTEMTEEDTLWNPSERESNESKSDRIYEFLVDFLAKRPESEIAVVGHSAWLFHMCNAVVDCGDDEEGLASWFLTSEIRSMRLTFTTTSNQQ